MYPVHRLNHNITEALRNIISADIQGNINQGLDNEVHFFDEESHISDVAKIVPQTIDGQCKVYLSSAFCQFLWLLCDVCLKEIDFSIIKEECQKNKIDLKTFKFAIDKILSQPQLMKQAYIGGGIKQSQNSLQGIIQILDEPRFVKSQAKEFSLLMSLLDKNTTIDRSAFDHIDIDGLYEQKVNSVYCFGIVFVLLHEMAHFSLNHLNKTNEMKEDEESADYKAFWDIYSDIDDNKRFSANIGILCVLFALLMINPNMEEDCIHPREDHRIFAIYDNIKTENQKYTVLLCKLFTIWAKHNELKDFPYVLSDVNEESLNKIRRYMDNYKWTKQD